MPCVGTQDNLMAYLYDLLTEDEEREIEQKMLLSAEFRELMNEAKDKKHRLESLKEIQRPSDLFSKTMSRIKDLSNYQLTLLSVQPEKL